MIYASDLLNKRSKRCPLWKCTYNIATRIQCKIVASRIFFLFLFNSYILIKSHPLENKRFSPKSKISILTKKLIWSKCIIKIFHANICNFFYFHDLIKVQSVSGTSDEKLIVKLNPNSRNGIHVPYTHDILMDGSHVYMAIHDWCLSV